MKANFDNYLAKDNTAKVFVKLKGLHLSLRKSAFNVGDIGKHITEKAESSNTGFLNIRHFRRYKNGKDLTGTKNWKGNEILIALGKKNQWTLVDL